MMMYRDWSVMDADLLKEIETMFSTSGDTKVTCMCCDWSGKVGEAYVETLDGDISAVVCPVCHGDIDDIKEA